MKRQSMHKCAHVHGLHAALASRMIMNYDETNACHYRARWKRPACKREQQLVGLLISTSCRMRRWS